MYAHSHASFFIAGNSVRFIIYDGTKTECETEFDTRNQPLANLINYFYYSCDYW